jgi:hypothetical protein
MNCRFTTMPSSPGIIRTGDFHTPPCYQSWVPHTYHYVCAILVYIPITNLWERSHLFHTVSTQPTIYDWVSIIASIYSHHSIFIPHPCLRFFKTSQKTLELFVDISRSKCTKIHSNIIHLHSQKNARKPRGFEEKFPSCLELKLSLNQFSKSLI